MSAVATVCPFCGVGCGLVLGVEAGRVTDVRPQAAHPASHGQLCAKGWNAEKFLRDPARLTDPARAPPRAPRASVMGRRAGDRGRRAADGARRSGSGRRRRDLERASDQRGQLRGDAVHPRRARHEQHRPLRARLPRALGGGAVADDRLRGDDELDRRHWPHRSAARRRLGHDRKPPHHWQPRAGGAGARRADDRDRPAPHPAGTHGRPSPAAPPRHRHPAGERDAARHLRPRLGGPRLPGRTLRERGRAAGGGRGVPARAGRRADRHPGGCDRGGGAPLRHHAPCLPRLRARRHAARVRDGERHRLLEPRARDRPRRRRGRRHQPAARPEQRPGRVRHGRAPRRLSGYQSGERPRRTREVRRGVGGRAARAPGAHDARHATRRARRGPARARPLRPGPGRHRPRAARGPEGAARPRLPGRRRALPHRDREARGRRPAGRQLRREGRHLHVDRAPRAARPPRDRSAGRVPARLGHPRGAGDAARPADGLHLPRADLRRDGAPHADLRGHELRTARRTLRAPVAMLGRNASGDRRSCTGSISRAGAAGSSPSATRRRPSSRTPSTRSGSPPSASTTSMAAGP